MLIVAIDPGLQGAVAVVNEQSELELLADLPIIRDGRLSWIDGGALQSLLLGVLQGRPARAIVERVGAMPRQGIASAFNFGVGFGSVLGVLQALRVGIELVAPSQWKPAFGLSRDKRASLDKARLLYPAADLGLAKHDGRAEAALLAVWALNRRNAP